MRHNIWKKYLKILYSWILILSICFLSLNVVVEASGTDMEMKGYAYPEFIRLEAIKDEAQG